MTLDPLIWQAASLVALLAASAFFSMSETALVSADRVQLRTLVEQKNHRAKRLERMLQEPEKLLSTVLVGNNLVNIGATAIATLIAVRIFGSTGAAIATGVMTFLVLVFAEISPKTLAVRRALPIALGVSGPLRIVEMVLLPFSWLFTQISMVLLRPFGIRPGNRAPFITQHQIETMVRMGVEEGEVEHFEQKVIQELFDFTETDVRRVLTPRGEVQYLQKGATLGDIVHLTGRTGHSRIPVVEEDFDHVLGFVHVKDTLRFSDEELNHVPVTEVLRAVLFAHQNTPSDQVLLRMQRERKYMTVVQDEDGINIGIVTMEDLLEELVGEIHDEFDPVKPVGKDKK